MGSRDRKNTGLYVLILVFLLSLLPLFYLWNRLREEEDLQRSLKQQIEGEKQAYQDAETSIGVLKEEIALFDEIDRETVASKERFFEMAKELETKILNGESNAKIAYLTFDDGPYLTTTASFLDVLDRYDVKATFFYLLKDERYDGLYRRVIDSGHTLANHTASHNLSRDGIYRSTEAFLEDLDENREAIQNRFGYTTELMRFPGGSSQAGPLKGSIVEGLRERHYGYVDWNVHCGDGKNSGTADDYLHGVLDNLEGQRVMVVLMHDYSYNTAKALPGIIEGLRAEGFLLLPLFYDSVRVQK